MLKQRNLFEATRSKHSMFLQTTLVGGHCHFQTRTFSLKASEHELVLQMTVRYWCNWECQEKNIIVAISFRSDHYFEV